MVKHIKAAKSVPSLPPRCLVTSDSGGPGASDWNNTFIPPQKRLIITTAKAVHTWDVCGITEIFRSGTAGIVSAKRLAGDKEMLAVADSQVVVLHEVKGGIERSYRLKGSEERIGLLKYAKDSNNLFFTTTLQNSVQSYSLQNSRLSETSHNHPTPPSAFAISCNSQFLLSTSAAPPTIYLTDMSLSMLPILLRPECSSSAVVVATFHPELVSYFVLAFADGTVAVFDAMHFFRKHDNKEHGARAAVSGVGGVLASTKGLHTQGTSTGQETIVNGLSKNGVDPGAFGFGDQSLGITAAAFVPHRKATVITVGGDGNCCIVDLTHSTKRNNLLVKKWHLRQPATSLSVACSLPNPLSQLDGTVEAPVAGAFETPNNAYYIAIGRQDGRVLLFDLDGKPIGEHFLSEDRTPIVDVEWTEAGEDDLAPPRRNSSPAVPQDSNPARKDLGSTVISQAHSLHSENTSMPSQVDAQSRGSMLDNTHPQPTLEGPLRKQRSSEPIVATNHLNFSPHPDVTCDDASNSDVTPRSTPYTPTTPSSKTVHRRTVLNSGKTRRYSTAEATSAEDIAPPPVPPRPSLKPGGLLSIRRAQSSHEAPADNLYPTLMANARRAKSTLDSQGQGRFGPRPMRSPQGHLSKRHTVALHEQREYGVSRDSALDKPPTPPPHVIQVQMKSPTPSFESFQTASSQVLSSDISDRSTDTVVDWDVGPTRQPFPSLEQSQPLGSRIPVKGARQKGHISLSNSSTSHDTVTPTSPSSLDEPVSPALQWPEASPRYSAAGLHASHRPTQSSTKTKPKASVHASIPLSLTSDDTVTQISSASTGVVVHWPSLRKSPRIPELNKEIPISGKKSSSRLVLEPYVESDSFPKGSHDSSCVMDRKVSGGQIQIYSPSLEAALNTSLSDFRAEIAQKFEEQRTWLENLIKGEDEGRTILEEENQWLRDQLDRLERERERGSSLS